MLKKICSMILSFVVISSFLSAESDVSREWIEAVSHADKTVIEEYIQSGIDINSQSGYALICAVERGDLEIVQLLVYSGADINVVVASNRLSPITSAMRYPHILEFLIDSGANLQINLGSRSTPLHYAISNSRYAQDIDKSIVVSLLIERGADVNSKNLSGETPLHLCAWSGDIKILTALIDGGANLYAKNDSGNTPLHLIYSRGDIEILKELVLRKIPLDDLNYGDSTALHQACLNRNRKEIKMELIKFLIEEQKMNVHQYSKDHTGTRLCFDALMCALSAQGYCDDFKILDYLLGKGANINAPQGIRNFAGRTHIIHGSALAWAIEVKLPQYIIEWMVQHGAKNIPGGWK